MLMLHYGKIVRYRQDREFRVILQLHREFRGILQLHRDDNATITLTKIMGSRVGYFTN